MPKTFIAKLPPYGSKYSKFKKLFLGILAYGFVLPALHAQESPKLDEPLDLKLEDQLLVRPIVPDDLAPTFTSSKKLDGVLDRQMRLEGDAVIRRNRTIVKGDLITYDPDTDIADVEGKAILLKDATSFKGPKAKIRMDAQEGWMEEPDYELRSIGGGGKASRVAFKEGNEFEFNRLIYTTCRPDNLDWYISASRMDVQQDTDSAVGENGVLHFLIYLFCIPQFFTTNWIGSFIWIFVTHLRQGEAWWRFRMGCDSSLLP